MFRLSQSSLASALDILEKDLGFVLYPVIACRPFQLMNFLPKSLSLVYVCNFICTAVSPCQGLSVIFSVVNDLYDIYIASLR